MVLIRTRHGIRERIALILVAVAVLVIITKMIKGKPHVQGTAELNANQNQLLSHQNQLLSHENFQAAMTEITYSCSNISVWGGSPPNISAGDGAKRLCLDDNIKPSASNCIVYSFGINEEWSFDIDAANYGCEVYCFDPSLKRKTSLYRPHIHFYNIGISNETGAKVIHPSGRTWPFMSFKDVVKMLGHENQTIDVVKIDVEWSEWKSLPQMLKDGSFEQIKQLLVEFHYPKKPKNEYATLVAMREYGLQLFDHSPRMRCNMPNRIYACYETSYINTRFL